MTVRALVQILLFIGGVMLLTMAWGISFEIVRTVRRLRTMDDFFNNSNLEALVLAAEYHKHKPGSPLGIAFYLLLVLGFALLIAAFAVA